MSDKSTPDLDLERKIKEQLESLEPTLLELRDESYKHIGHAGVKERGGRHYALTISSPQFAHLSLIKQHQLVYKSLNNLMNKEIHALAINIKS